MRGDREARGVVILTLVASRTSQERQQRRDLIATLLLRSDEALGGTRNPDSSGDSYPHLPSTWNRSYRELSRCIRELSRVDRAAFRHITGRYLLPPRRRLQEVRLRGRKLQTRTGHPRRWHTLPANTQIVIGTPRTDIGVDVIAIQWPDWVNPIIVERGLRWLEREFRGEPVLPHEFTCNDPRCDRCAGRLAS